MTLRRLAALTSTAALLASPAAAITIDGQLDAGYGAALVTQTTQTGLSGGQITGDNSDGDLNYANGSELDLLHATVAGGVLHLFLGGNLAMRLNQNQNRTVGHILDVFIDAAPGGQNTLSGLGTGHPLNGFTFDAGFAADYWLEYVGDANPPSGPPYWTASYASLDALNGGTLVMLGVGSAGGPGTLTGGTNPYGIQVTIDNRNVAGVTSGCAASSGAGVTTGIEWAIPLAAIGDPGACFALTVIVRDMGTTSPVSNQMLGPAPPGTCPPGAASTVNLATIAGDQFVTYCPSADAPRGAGPRELALLGARPNPSRGALRVAFRLAGPAPATLRLYDAAGRVLGEEPVTGAAGGLGLVELAQGRQLPAGVYWLVLSQAGASVTTRCALLR